MERQIKFRGKNKRTGEWCYGDLEYNRSKRIARIHSYDDEGRYLVQTEVDENTIGQFTGLHDKDGKEIYEGDIVSWLFFHGSLEVGKVEYKREEAQFRIVNRYTTMDNRESTTTIQNKRDLMVRGNIHDTPELLNEK